MCVWWVWVRVTQECKDSQDKVCGVRVRALETVVSCTYPINLSPPHPARSLTHIPTCCLYLPMYLSLNCVTSHTHRDPSLYHHPSCPLRAPFPPLLHASQVKKQRLEITYSYWDGSGHRRDIVVPKGATMYKFLEWVRQDLAKEFPELRGISAESLM